MLKKVTAVFSANKSRIVRKTAIIIGVSLGIGIGLLLGHDEENLIVVGEIIPAPGEEGYGESAESDENATDDSE
jgi:hypothetical protein